MMVSGLVRRMPETGFPWASVTCSWREGAAGSEAWGRGWGGDSRGDSRGDRSSGGGDSSRGGSGGVAGAAALARRGVRKVERAGLYEDFKMSIAALEIERRPTGWGAHHEGGVQRLADGLHGGRPVAVQQVRHVDPVPLRIGVVRHGGASARKDQRAMIDVRGTLVVEKRMEGDLGRWVAGALGGIGLRDQEDPAAQHVGEQPQAQDERGEQLAAAHTRVGTPGWAHVWVVSKSTNSGRSVR